MDFPLSFDKRTGEEPIAPPLICMDSPDLQDLLAQISCENLVRTVKDLSAFYTRRTGTAGMYEAAAWIYEQFLQLGYSPENHRYQALGFPDPLINVLCRKTGRCPSPRFRIACGHFDSVADYANPTVRAPGANDNATGIATILELARILQPMAVAEDVWFVALSGEEEPGFPGSTAFVRDFRPELENLSFLLNLDELGYPDQQSRVVVEYDAGLEVPANDASSLTLAAHAAAAIRKVTNSRVVLDEMYGSDYVPFEAQGYTAIGLFESGVYSSRHTAQDTIDKVDFDYLVEVTKAALVTMLLQPPSSF